MYNATLLLTRFFFVLLFSFSLSRREVCRFWMVFLWNLWHWPLFGGTSWELFRCGFKKCALLLEYVKSLRALTINIYHHVACSGGKFSAATGATSSATCEGMDLSNNIQCDSFVNTFFLWTFILLQSVPPGSTLNLDGLLVEPVALAIIRGHKLGAVQVWF